MVRCSRRRGQHQPLQRLLSSASPPAWKGQKEGLGLWPIWPGTPPGTPLLFFLEALLLTSLQGMERKPHHGLSKLGKPVSVKASFQVFKFGEGRLMIKTFGAYGPTPQIQNLNRDQSPSWFQRRVLGIWRNPLINQTRGETPRSKHESRELNLQHQVRRDFAAKTVLRLLLPLLKGSLHLSHLHCR